MKKILSLLFVLLATISTRSQTCPAGLNGIFKIGPTGTYRTLSAALDTLRARGVSGAVTLELQAAYTSATEVFPLSFSGISCLSATHNLTVRPEPGAANLLITSYSPTTLSFDNARYITIDGRPGGAGTTSALKIGNTSQAATAANFLNDASYNALRYLTIQSTNAGQQGHVYFGTSNNSVTNGNSYNEISNCVLKYETYNPNFTAIYSEGTYNKKNRGNVVRHCEIFNFNESGISLQRNNEAWQLEGNSFHSRAGRIAAIYINDSTSSGFVISGNYIGGTGPQCSGAAMQVIDNFTGMLLRTGSDGYTSVQNNTVANISLVVNYEHFFAGINLAMGKFHCGTEQGNTIGSQTVTNSIRFGTKMLYHVQYDLYGILAGDRSSGTLGIDSSIIRNNRISGIHAYYISGSGYGAITGISVTGQRRGYIEISNNTIGNPAQFNSIQNIAGGAGVVGISIESGITNIKNLVKNNLITNLSGNSKGIKVSQAGTQVIGNTIKGLYDTQFPDSGGGVYGIYAAGCTPGLTISGNTIHTLSAHSQSPTVCGIRLTYSSNALVEKNNIHSLQAIASYNVATFSGIDVDYSSYERIQNNMIRLGIDTLGNPINGDHVFRGINLSAHNSIVTHNSIYIGGTGNNESTGLNCLAAPQTIINNILFNARSVTAQTPYKHYAFRYVGDSIHRLGLNHNIYYVTGKQGYIATLLRAYTLYDATTIEQWRSTSKSDSNSMMYSPNFANPTGTVITGSLHLSSPNPAEGQGSADPLVTDDIDGDARPANSPTDIGADGGNFSLQDGDKPIITHDPFLGQMLSAAGTYTVYITDNGGGVDTTGDNRPRMWYRKKFPATSAWASAAGRLQSGTPAGGSWSFTPDLSLTGTTFNAGDSVEYYFVAQDRGPVINIGYSNKEGTLHSNVQAQSSAPTAPLRLLLMGYFPDTVYVGAGHTYTSLTNNGGFFEATNKMIFHPTTEHPVVYITSDLLAETATYRYTNFSTAQHTIRIQTSTPSVKQIRSIAPLPQALVNLYGAHHLVLDGSVNGSGRYLQFTSSQSIPSYGRPALSVYNSKAVTIQNCIFEGNLTGYEPVVSGSGGSLRLLITNNLIRNVETGTGAGLSSIGMALEARHGDTIEVSQNEIINFGSVGLQVRQSGYMPLAKVLIDSNHFYYNSSIAPVGGRTAITLSTFNMPVVVTNNYIGGSTPFCGGAPWTFSTQVSSAEFKGIVLDVSKDSISRVSHNTVRNIRFNSFGYGFYGIHAGGYSSVNLYANTIGDATTDSSIVSKQASIGIWANISRSSSITPQVLIQNNLVAGITAPTLAGIHVEAFSATVRNNRVTRLHSAGYATGISGYKGIKIWLEQGSVSGNEITDLIGHNSENGDNYGIEAVPYAGLPNEVEIERNTIARLQTVGSANAKLVGLYITNGQLKIRNNTISLINGPAASGATIYGMYFTGSAGDVFKLPVQYNTVYIGGTSNSTAKTAAVYVDGGSPIINFRNNLLYNERSGPGQHLALCVLPASGVSAWTKPSIANHNVYVTRDTAAINEWTTRGVMGLPLWCNYSRSDSASHGTTITNLPAAALFSNAPLGDLHINHQDQLSWHVNGKGVPISGVSGDMDSTSGVRSTSLATGATDIGADEFSASILPPALTITGEHQPNGTDSLLFDGKLVATIQWGPSGILPDLGEARLYNGVWPNDTTNNGAAYFARFLNAYWHIPATGGSGYSYTLTLYYDSSMLGNVVDAGTMVLNKRQPGTQGSWVEIQPTIVNTAARTITIHNQISFSEFTATDSLATLVKGVPTPDLFINTQETNLSVVAGGSKLMASFIESNKGTAAAGSRRINFYLSADNLLTPGNNGDTLIGYYEQTASLAAGANTGTLSKELFMPCTITPGSYYLFFTADGDSQLSEIDENNNASVVSIAITAGAVLSAPVITSAPQSVTCSALPVTLTARLDNCTDCLTSWNTGANTPTITVQNSDIYSVTVSNVCGSLTASQEVVIDPLHAFTVKANSDSICLGGSVTLTASGAESYTWAGQGLQSTTGSVVAATPTASGIAQYTLTGNSKGCTQTDTLRIAVQALPELSILSSDTLICAGSSVTLVASGAQAYTWSPATGLSSTSSANVTATPSLTTTYTVLGTTNGCSSSTSHTVIVKPVVTPSVTINYTGCGNGTLAFTSSSVNGGENPRFQWYVNNTPQGTGSNFTLNGAANGTQVYVTMTSEMHCASPQQVSSAPVTINCTTTALPSVDGLESFVAAPNPSRGVITLQMKLRSPKRLSIKIMDVHGNPVYETTPVTANGNVVKQIDLSGKAPGIYYFAVVIGYEQFIEKIVLTR